MTFYSGFNRQFADRYVVRRHEPGDVPLPPISTTMATLDLVVGNNGNGVFSVFEGSQAGLSLMNSFSDPSIDHPAAPGIGRVRARPGTATAGVGRRGRISPRIRPRHDCRSSNNNGNSTLLVSLSELGTSTISSLFGGTSTGLSCVCIARRGAGSFGRGIFHAKLHDQLLRRERHRSQPAVFVGDYSIISIR